MDIGTTLRDARLKRGMSVESISVRTKIKVDLLNAIEGNAFERLPAGVFARGFLRAYAHEVGLDSERIVSQYQASIERSNMAEVPVEPPPAHAPGSSPGQRTWADDWPFAVRPWQIITLLVVGALGFYAFAGWGGQQTVEQPAAAAAPAPSTPAPEVPPPVPVATAGKPLQITLEASRPCWVSATADGQRVLYRTLAKGERQTISVQDALNLRVGDAGALTASIDGVPGRTFGGPGQPVTLRITRENVREFLVR
jgi:hypothetical protein